MRRKGPRLAPVAAKIKQRLFECSMQSHRCLATLSDAYPDHPRSTWIGEAAYTIQAQSEALELAGNIAGHSTDSGQVAVFHFTQKMQRQMKIGGFNPLHVSARFRKL